MTINETRQPHNSVVALFFCAGKEWFCIKTSQVLPQRQTAMDVPNDQRNHLSAPSLLSTACMLRMSPEYLARFTALFLNKCR